MVRVRCKCWRMCALERRKVRQRGLFCGIHYTS